MATSISIAAQNLSWATRGTRILEDVSFDIGPGTIVACLGPNGAGKTTLLNILSGWIAPTAGRIMIDGHRRSLTPEIAFRLGIVRRFDPPKIIRELSISDNIRLADRETRHEGISDALFARRRIVSAEEKAVQRAEPLLRAIGLQDKLRKPSGELSIGEQKLLDFAVGLQADPRCLLLDEPLKDRVDDGRKTAIAQRLRDFAAQGGTAFIVEHDLDFVRNSADRVMVLGSGGRLVWEGGTADSRTWAAVEEIYHSRDRKPLSVSTVQTVSVGRGSAPANASAPPRLKASGLTARYGRTPILLDAAITLRAGEIATLRGENGAGKSTLLFALAGLVKATGKIEFDESDISNLPAFERARRGLVLLAQEHKVFPSMSVAENILLSATEGGRPGKDLLDRALGWFPELKGRIHVTADHLSAGQKQMVGLARTILRSPRCLLLDEPTSGLDPDMRVRARELVREAARNGAAILIVEHIREEAAEGETTTYIMKGGKIKTCASSAGNVD
jgi:branched-chain amino acid transport system ATP-binding protein